MGRLRGGGHSYMQADYHSTHKAGMLIHTPPLVLLCTWHTHTHSHTDTCHIAAFICAGQHRRDENAIRPRVAKSTLDAHIHSQAHGETLFKPAIDRD